MTVKPLDYVDEEEVIMKKRKLKCMYDQLFIRLKDTIKGSKEHLRIVKMLTRIEKKSKSIIRSNQKIFRAIKGRFWSHVEEVALDGNTVKR